MSYPGELHEISEAIGELRAGLAEEIRKSDAIFRRLDDIRDRLAVLMELQTTINRMEPEVEAFRRLRQRGIGILAAVALASGALGLFADNLWAVIARKLGLP